MRKRIYRNFFLITTISMVFITIVLFVVFFDLLDSQTRNDIHNKADFFTQTTNLNSDYLELFRKMDFSNQTFRLSIIDPSGTVLYDSYKDASTLDNHANRPEFADAQKKGSGEATRYSDTLYEKTFYYTVLLKDGNVLRVADTSSSVRHIFLRAVPVVFVMLVVIVILCNIISSRLTKRIIAPINSFNFSDKNSDIYDELQPFVRTIAKQNEQIRKQIADIEYRANTINTIIENMNEGILVMDKQGSILSANSSVQKIFGHTDAAYIGKSMIEFVRDVNLLGSIKKAMQGQNSDLMLTRNKRTLQVLVRPIFMDENLNGVIVFFLDISEKATAEKLRKEFTANVSHELKTPLTTVLALSEMLSNDMVNEKDIHSFTEKIMNEAKRLLCMVEDIIKISRLDEKYGSEIDFENYDIIDIIGSVKNDLLFAAEEKGISIEINSGVDSVNMNVNRVLFYEMIYNLVDNAIKYNNQNGKVIISIEKTMNKLEICIADTGIGIPYEHQNHVFERFYRVDKSRSKKTGGTGLGLSIVKHVVQIHGGTVTLESKEGFGSRFVMVFDLNK